MTTMKADIAARDGGKKKKKKGKLPMIRKYMAKGFLARIVSAVNDAVDKVFHAES